MIFYAGNDPEMVWCENPIDGTGPQPIGHYDEFFDWIYISDPTIRFRSSILHPEHPEMEIKVIELTEYEHFHIFMIESNKWIMQYIHAAVKAAEGANRNHRAFNRIMESIMANTGLHTNNTAHSLVRNLEILNRDDVFVRNGMVQKLIRAYMPNPETGDPNEPF